MSARSKRKVDQQNEGPPSSGRASIRIIRATGEETRPATSEASGKSREPKKPRSSKPKYAAPAGVPLPTMGLPALRYAINTKVRYRPDRVPALGKRELEAIAARQEQLDAEWQTAVSEYERTIAVRTVVALSDKVPQQVVCFVNSKGQGATTSSQVHGSSSRGQTTNTVVTSVDFNLAAGGEAGDSAVRHGKGDGGQTMTYRGLLEMLGPPPEGFHNLERDEVEEALKVSPQFGKFISNLRPTQYHVRVLAAEPIIIEDQELNAAETNWLLWNLRAKSEHVFIDTLNKVSDPVTKVVVRHSDVIVFTANADNPASLRHLWSSMQTLRTQGFADKVNHSVVLISNIPEGKTAEDFKIYLNRLNSAGGVVQRLEHLHVGQLVGVPRDGIIKLDGVVDLEALAWETRQAFIEADIAIFQQDPRFWNDSEASSVQVEDPGRPERVVIKGFKFAPDIEEVSESSK